MTDKLRVLVTGGGTGGHVIPALAVALVLKAHGHDLLFAGTRAGLEAKLVPEAGFPIEWVEIGGLNRVGLRRTLRTLWQLPLSIFGMLKLISRYRPNVVFSTGGFVAGPVVIASALRRLPIIVMEPNAVPGITNRWMSRFVSQALINFDDTARYFPKLCVQCTGLPVRKEFFALPAKPLEPPFTILITGGSRGSQKLNQAAIASWPLFAKEPLPLRLLHLTGTAMREEMHEQFQSSGLSGSVDSFCTDMAALFAKADLIVCRSGAGAVAEIAASGKPAILVPFPFASDDHQMHNAQVLAKAGAAKLVRDAELTGERLFQETMELLRQPQLLSQMGEAARRFAHPEAADQAARIIESVGTRNQTRAT